MPQPGDASYPGGRYRTIAADGMGSAHPGCSVARRQNSRTRPMRRPNPCPRALAQRTSAVDTVHVNPPRLQVVP